MSEQLPFFSIGITTFNRKDLLVQILNSLLKQRFTDFEVIVGNDFLEEKLTPEILGINDPRIRIINNVRNLGERENMNSLLNEAKGRYFSWQFDDDLCAPTFLNEVHSALVRYNFPLCIYSSFKYIYGTGEYTFPKKDFLDGNESRLYSGKEFLRRYLTGQLRILGLGGFSELDYLKKTGGVKSLSPGHMALYSEYLMVIKNGMLAEIAFINKPLVFNRIHTNSWSINNEEVELFETAGINLIKESLTFFSIRPNLIVLLTITAQIMDFNNEERFF